MKLADKVNVNLLYKETQIVIPIDNKDRKEAISLVSSLQDLPMDRDIQVSVTVKRQKRSLDQNGYFWQLLGELSNKLGIDRIEVYRSYIRDYGVGIVEPIKNEAVERFVEIWEGRGIGWVTDILGESKLKGFTNVLCYYGTSVYKTNEMTRMLDALIRDCKEQGIETLTPGELERMKQNG